MSRKRYLCIKNFDEVQHYKDRNPIWIKLHCALLEDYEFAQVADETKFHAVGLMLLASRLNNKFPDDELWLRRKINATSEINLELLLEIGFLDVVNEDAECKNNDKKTPRIARKSNKTQGDPASATFKPALAQNRTEENRTEENTTQQSRSENVLCVDDSKSSKPKAKDHRSEFSMDECLRYVEICQTKGEEIKNPKGLANHLFKTGEADSFIRAALFPEDQKKIELEIYGEPRIFSADPCRVCFGAKMSDADGKGFAACEHCKNEKGKSTGLEPEGAKEDD